MYVDTDQLFNSLTSDQKLDLNWSYTATSELEIFFNDFESVTDLWPTSNLPIAWDIKNGNLKEYKNISNMDCQ